MQKSLLKINSSIMVGLRKRLNILTIKVVKGVINYIKCLEGMGFFRVISYTKHLNYLYLIRLRLVYFNLTTLYSRLKVISLPSKVYYISVKNLRLLTISLVGGTYILSTPYGFITHHVALKRNIGGALILLISN